MVSKVVNQKLSPLTLKQKRLSVIRLDTFQLRLKHFRIYLNQTEYRL